MVKFTPYKGFSSYSVENRLWEVVVGRVVKKECGNTK